MVKIIETAKPTEIAVTIAAEPARKDPIEPAGPSIDRPEIPKPSEEPIPGGPNVFDADGAREGHDPPDAAETAMMDAPIAFSIARDLALRVGALQDEGRVLGSGGEFVISSENLLFADIWLGDFLSPVFLDFNGDGFLDLITGTALGNLLIYQGRSDGTLGAWEGDNPFAAVLVNNFAAPVLVDFDGDGDLDLIVGAQDGTVTAFRNGTIGRPGDFVATVNNLPLLPIDAGTGAAPALFDIDGDGDLDLIVGNGAGPLISFRNGGNGWSGVFSPWGANDPFAALPVDEGSTPTFVDLDLDGDLDLVVGTRYGEFISFINGGNGWSGRFRAWGENDPFAGLSVGQRSAPTFADIDGDGDLDMITGAGHDGLVVFENLSGAAARYDFAPPAMMAGPDEFVL